MPIIAACGRLAVRAFSSMKPKKQDQIGQALDLHMKLSAPLRRELAARSAAEMLFDDLIVAELRNGASFAAALQKANATYPSEALNPVADQLAELETRYRFMVDMAVVDEGRNELERIEREIKTVDQKIAELLNEIGTQPSDVDPKS